MYTIIKASVIVAATAMLSGCLTSPFYGQVFSSRSDEVSFQLWTTDSSQDITLECAKASAHGGRWSGGDYQPLTTITPSSDPHYDYHGGDSVIYQASTKVVIPSSCWRYYNYPGKDDYITVVRITQGSHGDDSIYTFDKEGLGCLGQWVGKTGLFSWFGKGCEKRYINTGEPIRTVFLKAES